MGIVHDDGSLESYRARVVADWKIALSGAIADRADIVAVFATLPDEAFGYIAMMLWQTARGNGGFQDPSKQALNALSAAFGRWLDEKRNAAEHGAIHASETQGPTNAYDPPSRAR